MSIEAIQAVGGDPEWGVPSVGSLESGPDLVAPAAKPEGFGTMLGQQIGRLQELQQDAASQSQALATGTADDPTSVILAVDRARLSMQFASQLRERGVTALQEILRTQV